MTPDDLIDPDLFFVNGPVYFIAPLPRPADPEEMKRGLLRMASAAADGTKTKFVPLFTDLDLANRCVESLGEHAAHYKPLTFRNKADLAAALDDLRTMGDTHVAFDPEPNRVHPCTIAEIVHAIRTWKG